MHSTQEASEPLPRDDGEGFAWRLPQWRESGIGLDELSFPRLTNSEIRTRLGPFLREPGTHLADLDWCKLLRKIFAIPVLEWRRDMSCDDAATAVAAVGIPMTVKALQVYQPLGSWVLDVAWTELRVRGGQRDSVHYIPVPSEVYLMISP